LISSIAPVSLRRSGSRASLVLSSDMRSCRRLRRSPSPGQRSTPLTLRIGQFASVSQSTPPRDFPARMCPNWPYVRFWEMKAEAALAGRAGRWLSTPINFRDGRSRDEFQQWAVRERRWPQSPFLRVARYPHGGSRSSSISHKDGPVWVHFPERRFHSPYRLRARPKRR
jgi:hypothetical protein